MPIHKFSNCANKHARCESGTRTPGPGTSGPWDPGPPSKFKSGTPGLPPKSKSGTLIIIFLHCLNYFSLDKYNDNMETIFHE